MKKALINLLFFFWVLVCSAQSSVLQWMDFTMGYNFQQPKGMVIGADGNIYFAGYFTGNTFVAGSDTLTKDSSASANIFLIKSSPGGNNIWAKAATGSSDIYTGSLCADKKGFIYLAGEFLSDSIEIDGLTAYRKGLSDVFIAKFDLSGNLYWIKNFGDSNPEGAYVNSIISDTYGNVYITGGFYSGYFYIGDDTLSSGSHFTYYITKYTENGDFVWAKSVGHSNGTACEGLALSADESGNIYVAGDFYTGQIIFDSITLTNSASAIQTPANIFIAKYNPNGKILWAQKAGGDNDDEVSDIVTDQSGNAYITGYFVSDTLNFGTYSLIHSGQPGNSDFFVAKFSATGDIIWAKGSGGDGDDYGFHFATDSNNEILLSGAFNGNEFIYDSIHLLPPSLASNPMFTLLLDSDGKAICTTVLGAGGTGQRANDGNYVQIDNEGNQYITAGFTNRFLAGSDTISASGNENAFLAKFYCGMPTDVNEIKVNDGIFLYPNPTANYLQGILSPVVCSATGNVTSADGKILKQDILLKPGKFEMDVSSLAPGVYFLTVYNNGKQYGVARFVKVN